jgi:hypothetical protein
MAAAPSMKTRSSSSKSIVVWEWLNEYGKWRQYSPEAVVFIEREGQMSKKVNLGLVSPSLKMYTVDVTSMCQIREGTGLLLFSVLSFTQQLSMCIIMHAVVSHLNSRDTTSVIL